MSDSEIVWISPYYPMPKPREGEIEWMGSYFYKGEYRGYAVVNATNLIQARERVKQEALKKWSFGPEHLSLSAVTPTYKPFGPQIDYRYWMEENAKLDPVYAAWLREQEEQERELQRRLDARWKCHECFDLGWLGDTACPACGLWDCGDGQMRLPFWWLPPDA